MLVLRIFLSLLFACFGLPMLASAQSLSAKDCQEIRVQYGVNPAGCALSSSTATGAETLTARMRESHVFFLNGGTRLDARARVQLTKLVAVLETPTLANACLKLVGHSDAIGKADANLALSLKRAQVVSDFLSRRIENPVRVEQVLGMGELQILDGFTPNAAENRRVEIYARDCPPH